VRKVAIVASAAGSGATTVGRQIAERLGVPFHELDALHWKPGWEESTPEELRAALEPLVAAGGWVIDGSYQGKIGQLVIGSADVVVWLDLPPRTWLPRLVRRTIRRARTGEELWNGNRESLRQAFLSRDSLILFTLRHFRARRRTYPERFASYDVVRLRSQREIDAFLRTVEPAT
jgi:adenylate kinase family enzyme